MVGGTRRVVILDAAPTLTRVALPLRGTRSSDSRSRRTSFARWTPTGGPPTTSRSGRSTSSTIRCSRSRCSCEHIKPRLLGHWGTTPGLNFIYVHLNRVIKQHDLNVIYVTGPGHGGPGLVANTYLEGHLQRGLPEHLAGRAGHEAAVQAVLVPRRHPQPRRARDARLDPRGRRAGLLARRTPTARRSTTPTCSSAAWSATARPRPAPLATSWHSNKFLNPARDGAVLPILHLNGYKIAGPTVLARISHDELEQLFRGYGYKPVFRRRRRPGGDAPAHGRHARRGRRRDQAASRADAPEPTAFTAAGPLADDRPAHAQGLDRAQGGRRPADRRHVPRAPGAAGARCDKPEHVEDARTVDEELPAGGAFRRRAAGCVPELAELAPKGERRMGANPHANGGLLLKDLRLPDFRDYAVDVPAPGAVDGRGHARAGRSSSAT